MTASIQDRTLALAGLFQAMSLVKAVATTGHADTHDMEVCLNSLMELNPHDLQAIYGPPSNLRTGLRIVLAQLGADGQQPDMEIARYSISLLHLERKLSRDTTKLQRIRDGIARAKTQLAHFPLTHENILANLAGIYSDTVSQIPPKIMVSGDNQHLGDTANANRIRALLLSGMRAVVLWRQLGGSRWQLIFRRRHVCEAARHLLQA